MSFHIGNTRLNLAGRPIPQNYAEKIINTMEFNQPVKGINGKLLYYPSDDLNIPNIVGVNGNTQHLTDVSTGDIYKKEIMVYDSVNKIWKFVEESEVSIYKK